MADWDTSNPTDNAVVAQYPANERAARSALVANFAVDHYSTNDANVGKHTVVRLLEQSAQTATAGEGKLYAKDTSGQSELFWISDTGSPIQLTSGANGLLVNATNILSGTLPDARLSSNVPLLNASNTFTVNQTIATGTAPRLFLDDTGAGAGLRKFFIESDGGHFAIATADDGGAGVQAAIDITKNASSAVTAMALSATSITLNGVASSDFARLSQNNTFLNASAGSVQSIQGEGQAALNLYDTSGTSGARRVSILVDDSTHFYIQSLTDAGSSTENLIDAVMNGSSQWTSLALAADAITVNGVNVTDFARLSQSNTFTGATQAITASGADAAFTAARSGGASVSFSGSSTYGILGTTSNSPLAIVTNGSTKYEISAAGNHDFKGGTVLAAQIANSTSTTLVAGQLHFIDGNATLPNLTAGQWIQVINDGASARTISVNGSDTTYYTLTGATIATSFTLEPRGVLTARCNPAGTAVYVSGSGISAAS